MPSTQKMALEFAEPVFAQPDFEVPEGLTWDYRKRACYDENGRRYDQASGWMVDDATGTFYQMGTGYRYVSHNGDFLLDEATGTFYDFSMQPSEGPQADFELPAGTTWNPITLKAEDDKGRYYDTGSGCGSTRPPPSTIRQARAIASSSTVRATTWSMRRTAHGTTSPCSLSTPPAAWLT